MKLVYAKEFVVVEHDKTNRQLHVTWRGYITSEEYILTVRELLRLTATLGICSWLCDMRGAEGIRETDVRWEENCITSSPHGSRLLRIARLPAAGSGQAYRNHLAGYPNFSGKLPAFREFTLQEEARRWLQEVAHQPCLAQ